MTTAAHASAPERRAPDPPSLPTRPEGAPEEDAHEVENPGDPGPTVLVPPAREDPREDPRIPPTAPPAPGV